MIVALAAALWSAQANQEQTLDGSPVEWMAERAPFGMDITLDRKVWINTNPVGARDDYAILANDLYEAVTLRSVGPRVWVRGYHIKNKRVGYRESKQLVSIDCLQDTVWVQRRILYDASGYVISSDGPFASEYVVPGSVGEVWLRAACRGAPQP